MIKIDWYRFLRSYIWFGYMYLSAADIWVRILSARGLNLRWLIRKRQPKIEND